MIEGREWHGKSISIHSLRVEGDGRELHDALGVKISIHSLRVEGDQVERADQLYRAPFQSTPSVWRETVRPHDKEG